MKTLFLIIPFIIISCTTAEISADKTAMRGVKVIAIAPFKSTLTDKKINREISLETEDLFSSVFTKFNYRVIRNEKIDPASENNYNLPSETLIDYAVKTAKLAGADAVFMGDIVVHGEIKRDIHPRRSILFKNSMFHDGDDEIRTEVTYKFQIVITVVRVSDSSVILTMKNRYSDALHDEYLPGYISLEAYRRNTLKKISDELEEFLNSSG